MAKPQLEDSDEATPVLEVVVQLPSSAPPSATKKPPGSSSSSSTSSSSRALFSFPSKWDDAEKWLRSSSKSAPSTGNKKQHFRKLQIQTEDHQKSEGETDESSEADREKKMMIDSSDGRVSVVAPRFSFPSMPRTGNCGEEMICEDKQGVKPHSAVGQLRIQKPSTVLTDASFDIKQQQQQQNHQPKSPTSLYESVACIAPGAERSISMRDMGTEMTPIASQEPSRTGTPMRTPPMISPRVSPGKIRPIPPPPPAISSRSNPLQDSDPPLISIDHPEQQAPPKTLPPKSSSNIVTSSTSMSSMKSSSNVVTSSTSMSSMRQEIRVLGTQLGKSSIAAWATREEEDADASKCLKVVIQQPQQQINQVVPLDSHEHQKDFVDPGKPSVDLLEIRKSVIESRAAAWEEAEYSKYMARYEREEAKILAWENHQKAKAEAELRRMEVKMEKMRSHAQERVMNKLATAKRRAEELRAAAEAKRGEKAAQTAERAVEIRKGGRVSSSSPSHFLRCCLAGA